MTSSYNDQTLTGWSECCNSAFSTIQIRAFRVIIQFYKYLFHDLLLRSYLYHCVWSVITAHNLTPEKRDALVLRLVGLVQILVSVYF